MTVPAPAPGAGAGVDAQGLAAYAALVAAARRADPGGVRSPVDAVWAVADAAAGDTALVLAHLAAGAVDDLVAAALAARGDAAAPADPDAGGAVDDDAAADDDAIAAVRAAVTAVRADPRDADRLALGARRVLGEALAAAVAVLGAPPPGAVLKALKSQHRRRGAAVGL